MLTGPEQWPGVATWLPSAAHADVSMHVPRTPVVARKQELPRALSLHPTGPCDEAPALAAPDPGTEGRNEPPDRHATVPISAIASMPCRAEVRMTVLRYPIGVIPGF